MTCTITNVTVIDEAVAEVTVLFSDIRTTFPISCATREEAIEEIVQKGIALGMNEDECRSACTDLDLSQIGL